MESIIYVFNTIATILKDIISGFIEFINTIPILFQNIGEWANNLFPSDFSAYIIALVPIIITIMVIKFVRG